MSEENEKVGYVVFIRCADDQGETLLFLEEFEELVDAEEFKAQSNQKMAKDGYPIEVTVGVGHFYEDEEKEENDYILVTPRDNSKPFKWHQMVHKDDAIVHVKQLGLVK